MRYLKYFIVVGTISVLWGIAFSPDTQLSSATGCAIVSLSGHNIAVTYHHKPPSHLFVIWTEAASPTSAYLCTRRSADGGKNWNPFATGSSFSTDTTELPNPAVASDGDSTLHLAYTVIPGGSAHSEIYYQHSTNDGVFWNPAQRMTTTSAPSQLPILAVAGDTVHLVWREDLGWAYDFHYNYSTDKGGHWKTMRKLTSAAAMSPGPDSVPVHSFAASAGMLHVIWDDGREMASGDIYYKRSLDGGANWSQDVRLTSDGNCSRLPAVAADGNFIGVVWIDWAPYVGNHPSAVVFKRSSDGGNSWGDSVVVGTNPKLGFYPQIAIKGNTVAIAWGSFDSTSDSLSRIIFSASYDSGQTWTWPASISPAGAQVFGKPSLVFDDSSVVHIARSDNRTGKTMEVYYNNFSMAVGVDEKAGGHGRKGVEMAITPACFRNATRITYYISCPGPADLSIWDTSGRLVKVLARSRQGAGFHFVSWDGSEEHGGESPAGIYICRLTAGGTTVTRKLIRLE